MTAPTSDGTYTRTHAVGLDMARARRKLAACECSRPDAQSAPRAALWRDTNTAGYTDATAVRMHEPPYTLLGPMRHNNHLYSADSYSCHDFKAADTPATTIVAGTDLSVEWFLEATHPGDCALYVSYDAERTAPLTWFKLADFAGCGSADGTWPPSSNTYPRAAAGAGCRRATTACCGGSGSRCSR